MTTKNEDLKKLAEVTQYYFHAHGMTRKGEHGDDGDHVYWVRYSDVEHLLAQAREDALEEAAKMCDEKMKIYDSCALSVEDEEVADFYLEKAGVAHALAQSIRALKHTGEDGETKP